MRIGVQLPEVERVVRWPELRRMAQLAEVVGFDSLWVGDHYLYRHDGDVTGPWEAWTLLAGLAAVTDHIALAPFVASLTFHHPAVLAKQASTVDEISGGRLIMGVGAGWNETEYRAFGLPYERRVDRFEEAFHIVRRLLGGESVSIEGEFTTLERCVLEPPSARSNPMRFMVGSTGRRMLDITIPFVDAWNAWFVDFDNLPERIPDVLRVVESACARAGRDPSAIEKSVALLLDFGSSRPRAGSINPITGDPAAMADALHRVAAAGIDHVQLVLDPITESTIERAAAVVARFRA